MAIMDIAGAFPEPPPEEILVLAADTLREGIRTQYGIASVALSETLHIEHPTDDNTVFHLDASHMAVLAESPYNRNAHDTRLYWLDGVVPERVFARDYVRPAGRLAVLHHLPHFHNAAPGEIIQEIDADGAEQLFRWMRGEAERPY